MSGRGQRAAVSGVSLAYDVGLGLGLLVAPDALAAWFGARVPDALFVRLNAIFLIAVGLGYLQPLGNPEAHRAYLWIFGAGLKSAGAVVFLSSVVAGASPPAFLVFMATDGGLALWTLAALRARG